MEDRRKKPTPVLSRYTLIGRRRGFRRDGEDKFSYVDIYDSKAVLLVVCILVLSILDGLFTLLYLGKGGKELNILVDWLIAVGTQEFFIVKAGLTGLSLIFLILHKNFPLVSKALLLIFYFYLGLLIYHLVIQILLLL